MNVDLFAEGMRMLASGVTIVTTEHETIKSGLTATAVCSLSADPPRLLTCINKLGQSYKMISESRSFCVNILAFDQVELAKCFAGLTDNTIEDRFTFGTWIKLKSGAPALKGALASFDCRVETILDSGSHGIIIGDILDISINKGSKPLLYMDGDFKTTI
ncbi:MAG: flavin reductase family protein [Sphingomonadales bacterium]|jgi:flavin reductase (DIM6/NTAB) family NADH-FMN oxidoreductase RutF